MRADKRPEAGKLNYFRNSRLTFLKLIYFLIAFPMNSD